MRSNYIGAQRYTGPHEPEGFKAINVYRFILGERKLFPLCLVAIRCSEGAAFKIPPKSTKQTRAGSGEVIEMHHYRSWHIWNHPFALCMLQGTRKNMQGNEQEQTRALKTVRRLINVEMSIKLTGLAADNLHMHILTSSMKNQVRKSVVM